MRRPARFALIRTSHGSPDTLGAARTSISLKALSKQRGSQFPIWLYPTHAERRSCLVLNLISKCTALRYLAFTDPSVRRRQTNQILVRLTLPAALTFMKRR
jgi:hypothetical protein